MLHRTFLPLFTISMHIYTVLTSSIAQNPTTKNETHPPFTCYECLTDKCNNPYNVTCDGGLQCFTHTEIINGKYLLREKGCLKGPFATLTYCYNGIGKRRQNGTNMVHTCCSGNFCNDDEFEIPNISEIWTLSSAPTIQEKQMEKIGFEEKVLPNRSDVLSIFIATGFVVFITIVVVILAYFIVAKRSASDLKAPGVVSKLEKITYDSASHSVWTSGSGSGMPTLNQRSLSQDVNLIKCIAQGRYGEVWQGQLKGENVAVKIFSSVDTTSWQNEVNIYTDIALYHENVLGFKGSTVSSRFGATELWLLTTFHEQGSLYDYLLENPISLKQMIEFIRSASSGLLHLHTEIFGSKGKPAIAHRDLKTRNILITSHGTCVLADFGLALVKRDDSSSPEYPENYKVGTKRYMAPEVLHDTMKTNSFESYKQADIYSFGLILWEVCSRCTIEGSDNTFRLAFHDCVPNNPDFEDMKKVVCTELKRPDIPDSWLSNEPLIAMAELMKHCWHKNPEVRYTACRVKKTLDRIYATIQEMQSSIQIVWL